MTNDTFDPLRQQYRAGTITLADSNRLVDELIMRSDRWDTNETRKCLKEAGDLAQPVVALITEIGV